MFKKILTAIITATALFSFNTNSFAYDHILVCDDTGPDPNFCWIE